MRIPEFLYLSLIFFGSIIGIIMTTYAVACVIIDIMEMIRFRKFKDDITYAITNNKISWNQVLDIAETRNIKKQEIYTALQILIREALTGRTADLQSHISDLQLYLQEFREVEPFERIPNEIRIHLERLKEHVPDSKLYLHPLASQIRELLSIKDREHLVMKRYTMGGFFIGLAGLIFAAYTYVHPINNDSTQNSFTNSSQNNFTNSSSEKLLN